MSAFQEFKFSTGKIKVVCYFFVGSSHFFSKASAQPQIQHTVKKSFQWSSFNQPFLLTYCSNWLHTSAKQLLFLLYKHLYFCCQCPHLRHYLHFSSDRCCVSWVWFHLPFPSDADHPSFFMFSGLGLLISLLFARVATNSKTKIHLSVCNPGVHLKVMILGGVWIWISLLTHGLGPIAPRDYPWVPFFLSCSIWDFTECSVLFLMILSGHFPTPSSNPIFQFILVLASCHICYIFTCSAQVNPGEILLRWYRTLKRLKPSLYSRGFQSPLQSHPSFQIRQNTFLMGPSASTLRTSHSVHPPSLCPSTVNTLWCRHSSEQDFFEQMGLQTAQQCHTMVGAAQTQNGWETGQKQPKTHLCAKALPMIILWKLALLEEPGLIFPHKRTSLFQNFPSVT